VRRSPAFAATLGLALLATGCRSESVRVTFRPAEGARYEYEVRVRSESLVEVDGRAPRRSTEEVVLAADHTVLASGAGGSQVQVRLQDVGGSPAPRTFVVRLDRAAQLFRIERVEGLPADVLGELGLSEIFPAAAGAAPDRPLAPGERWKVDEPLELPGLAPTRLQGYGRVAELGIVRDRHVAVVQTVTELPVRRTTMTADGAIDLRGAQTTRSAATHALADGAVEEADSRTRAEFRLELRPPSGDVSVAVRGRIVMDVRSVTRRVR
jgi:hypothetical protein